MLKHILVMLKDLERHKKSIVQLPKVMFFTYYCSHTGIGVPLRRIVLQHVAESLQ